MDLVSRSGIAPPMTMRPLTVVVGWPSVPGLITSPSASPNAAASEAVACRTVPSFGAGAFWEHGGRSMAGAFWERGGRGTAGKARRAGPFACPPAHLPACLPAE
eukprot:151112-Chlamydomonas_euryale.AAC.1